MRTAATHFISVAAGNYAAIALSFAINLALTRTLGVERFGHLALLLTASQLLAIFAANWNVTALIRFGAVEFATSGRLAKAFWTRAILVAPGVAVLGIVLVAAADPIATFLDIRETLLAIVFVHFLCATGFFTACAAFQAAGRMPLYALCLVGERAVAVILVFVLVVVGGGDEMVALVSLAASAAIAAIVAFVLLRRELSPIWSDPANVREMWRFSLPLIASTWAGLLGSQWTDYLFVRRYLTIADLGHYSLAYQLSGVVQQVTIVASTLLLPRLASLIGAGRIADAGPLLRRLLPYWLLSISIGVAVALIGTPFAIPLLFGPQFGATTPPLAVLLVSTITLGITNSLTPYLAAIGQTWVITRIMLAAAGVNLIFDLLLIPTYGVVGAAVATLLANIVSLAVTLMSRSIREIVPASRFLFFVAPIATVYAGYRLFEGVAFVVISSAAVAAWGWVLVLVFGLHRRENLSVLRGVVTMRPR